MTDVLGKFLEQEGGEEVDSILAFVNAKQLGLRQIIVAGLRALKSEISDSDVLSNSYSRCTPTFDHYASQQPSSMVPTVSSLPTLFSNGIFLRHHALHQTYDQNACAIGLSLEAIMPPNCLDSISLVPRPCHCAQFATSIASGSISAQKGYLGWRTGLPKSRAKGLGQPWHRRSWEVAPWFLEKWG
jgi:hypothetical protein